MLSRQRAACGAGLAAVVLSGFGACAKHTAVAVTSPPVSPTERQIANAADAGDGDYNLNTLRARLNANPLDFKTRLELAQYYQRTGYPEFLAILAPGLLGMIDQAASALALAAAARLNSTTEYNFGSVLPGVGTSSLTSAAPSMAYFNDVASALAAYGQSAATSIADGTTPRHVTVNLSAPRNPRICSRLNRSPFTTLMFNTQLARILQAHLA
jgi:hypothetical protein